VRIAVAIDTHDREIIVRIATQSRGTSGEMILDMMLDRVEQRFNGLRAPEPVQSPADNSSAYTAAKIIDFATALKLVSFFTPVRSPESNEVCEAFVKTLERTYAAQIQCQMPSRSSSSCRLGSRHKTISTRIRGLCMRSPSESIASELFNHATCPV
jgi:transposase InsO family protein